MRQYGGFKFSSPKGYSDWAKYAGFDRSTGTVPGGIAPGGGMLPVAPSGASSGTDLMQQITNAGNAMQQLGQGNVSQAYNTMFSGQPAPAAKPAAGGAAAPTDAAPVDKVIDAVEPAFDYLSELLIGG